MGAMSATEAKEENSIDPLTAIANPRQIRKSYPWSKIFR